MGVWIFMTFWFQGQGTDGLLERVRVAPSYFIENNPKSEEIPPAGSAAVAFLETEHGRIRFGRDGFFFGSAATIGKNGEALPVLGFGPAARKRGGWGPRLVEKTRAPYHYLVGDPSQWRTHVPTYRKLVYPQVWEGIDVHFRGFRDRLEAQWVLEPSANPSQIRMNLEGETLTLLPDGSLSVPLGQGALVLGPLKAFQTIGGKKVRVDAAYKVLDRNRFQFELGPYQAQSALVISPVITWSSVFGDDTSDTLEAVDFDSSGNIVIGGTMQSTTIGAIQASFQNAKPGNRDAFITKLNAAGTVPGFSVFLGDGSDEEIKGLAVMPDNSFWVMGRASGIFPVTDGSTNQGFGDIFLTHLSADGSTILYSTLVGGSSAEFPHGLKVSGNLVAVCGETSSNDFPVTGNALDTSLGGSQDGFVRVLDSNTNTWIFSSYLGGSDNDQVRGVDFDATSGLILCGATGSADFPTTAGAFDTSYGGISDGFITKISSSFALVYSSFIGGSGFDSANDVLATGSGEAVVTGRAGSNFPTTAGVLDPDSDFQDAFLLKMNASGTNLAFSTALGGNGADEGLFVRALSSFYCVAGTTKSSDFPTSDGSVHAAEEDLFLGIIDDVGQSLLKATVRGGQGRDLPARLAVRNNAPHVVGRTFSADFPMVGASLQGAIRGSEDGFLTIFDSGLNLTYATFLGGEGLDSAESAALDSNGNIVLTGSTTSDHFPVTVGHSPFFAGKGADAFVCKLSQDGSTLMFSARLGGNGNDFPKALALDLLDDIYIAGVTDSTNFHTSTGAFDTSHGGLTDGFLLKLNDTADCVVYSSFLGGTGQDEILGLAVLGGSAQVAGRTSSTDFPTTAGAVAATYQGGTNDGFLTKFNTTGTALLYSSFIGGSGDDRVIAVAVNTVATFLTGYTTSNDFPTTAGAWDETYNGNRDMFVTRLTNTGALFRSTYLGGASLEQGQAIMLSGPVPVIAGWTQSSDFPTQNAWDASFNGGFDGVLVKLDANLSSLTYSTFLGSTGSDIPTSLSHGMDFSVWVAGNTSGGGFPSTPGAYQSANQGANDLFAMRFSPTGSTLEYATLLGGTGNDNCRGILANNDGSVVLVGVTTSADYPITPDAYMSFDGGALDVSVTRLCPVPTPGDITGPAEVCENLSSVSYSIVALPGIHFYEWTVPAGAVILSGQTTTSITVDLNGNAGEIAVQAQSGCGLSAKAGIQVSIDAAVGAVGAVQGSNSFCQNDIKTFSVDPVPNATDYAWTVPGGSTIQSGQGTPSVTVLMGDLAGDVFVEASNTCSSESSPPKALHFVPFLADLAQITGSGPYCRNTGGYTFSVPALAGATDYQWTVPVDATITSGQGTNAIVVALGTALGNLSVVAANACDTTAPSTLNITASDILGFTEHPETQFSCIGEDITFSVAVDGSPPIDLQWYKDGLPLNEFGNTLTLTHITAADEGVYECLAEGPCISEFSNQAGLFLDGIPTLTMNPPTRALGIDNPEFQLEIVCETPPYTLDWSTDPAGLFDTQGDGIVLNPAPSETTFIQCDYTDSAGNGTFTSFGLLLVAQDGIYRDLNQDGCNNLRDLWLLVQDWGTADSNDPDGDGWIDVRDFLYLNFDDPLDCPQ